jgi:Protein of unknown function (DUF3237)
MTVNFASHQQQIKNVKCACGIAVTCIDVDVYGLRWIDDAKELVASLLEHDPRTSSHTFGIMAGLGTSMTAEGGKPNMDSQIDQHGDQSAPRLEFVFQIRIDLGERVIFGPLVRGGKQGFVAVQGGEITGPRLQGRVLAGTGGDYPYIWPDGTFEFDAHYLVEASDGTKMRLRNHGYRHGPKEVIDRLLAYEQVDPSGYYMRMTPSFEVPAGPHEWLGRTVFVGTGNRRPDYSIFRYWAVY